MCYNNGKRAKMIDYKRGNNELFRFTSYRGKKADGVESAGKNVTE